MPRPSRRTRIARALRGLLAVASLLAYPVAAVGFPMTNTHACGCPVAERVNESCCCSRVIDEAPSCCSGHAEPSESVGWAIGEKRQSCGGESTRWLLLAVTAPPPPLTTIDLMTPGEPLPLRQEKAARVPDEPQAPPPRQMPMAGQPVTASVPTGGISAF
jgi:hypothetical protein